MKLVAVSRILNEEDIIESMVRHHAFFVDHHIILDNGSVDRTLDILTSLKAEGMALTVLQNEAVTYSAEQFNTELYHVAATRHGADWVLFLDADEFIDARGIGDLRDYLQAIPPDVNNLGLQLINYQSPSENTEDKINVVERFARRNRGPAGVWKVFIRGNLATSSVTIAAGNHGVYLSGVLQNPRKQDEILLAHYPTRSPLQFACKAVTGRLKVLAAGQSETKRGRSKHYVSAFESLMQDPETWIRHSLSQFDRQKYSPDLVVDPIPYMGQPLCYTKREDYGWRALRLFLANMEKLARAFGDIMDKEAKIRDQIETQLHDLQVLIGPDRLEALSSGQGVVLSSNWRTVTGGDVKALFGAGWSVPEDWGGVWGTGPVHELRLVFPVPPQKDIEIQAEVEASLAGSRKSQVVDIFVREIKLGTWAFDAKHNRGLRTVFIPASLIGQCMPVVSVELHPQSVASPAELDPTRVDDRKLGIAIRRIRLLTSRVNDI